MSTEIKIRQAEPGDVYTLVEMFHHLYQESDFPLLEAGEFDLSAMSITWDEEVAISYWENEEQIKAWKADPEHVQAQEKGRSKWYQSYHVQGVKVIREYGENT